MPTLQERFWRKVIQNPIGCWGWSGTTSKGYGVLSTGPRGANHQIYAHRVSFEIHHGPIPAGLNVCHRCDNPPCSRPEHLYAGSDRENMRDRDVRGRHGTAKLNPRQVRTVRALAAAGEKQIDIARYFGISNGQISQIVNRLSYKHVE